MADASGLDQQQAIAANIPYKNIALGNPAETFLNAWKVATDVKTRQKEVEGKMQQLALRNQQLELDSQQREREFGIKMAMQQQGMGMREAALSIAAQRMQLAQDAFDNKSQSAMRRQEGNSGVLQAESSLYADGINPGDKNFEKELLSRTAPFAATASPAVVSGIQRNAMAAHNTAVKAQAEAFNADQRNFYNDIGRTLYRGNTLTQNLNPIMYPETLQPVTEGGWLGTGYGAKTVPDKLQVPQPDGSAPVVVSTKAITDLRKRWDDIQARRGNLAAPVNRPDLGVTPGGSVTIKTSSGKQWTIPQEQLDQAKQRDPGLTIVP